MKTHAYSTIKQYTIRNVPVRVDQFLRRRAKSTGKSFNQVVLDALVEGVGEKVVVRDDLDFLIGSMTKKDAGAIEKAVQSVRKIDRELW